MGLFGSGVRMTNLQFSKKRKKGFQLKVVFRLVGSVRDWCPNEKKGGVAPSGGSVFVRKSENYGPEVW